LPITNWKLSIKNMHFRQTLKLQKYIKMLSSLDIILTTPTKITKITKRSSNYQVNLMSVKQNNTKNRNLFKNLKYALAVTFRLIQKKLDFHIIQLMFSHKKVLTN
jgi:hypothetical protein